MALAEVSVALVIVVVGWLAVLGLQQQMARTALDARVREEARWTLQAVADSLALAGGAGEGRIEAAWGWVEWRTSSGGVLLRATATRDSVVGELWTWTPGPP